MRRQNDLLEFFEKNKHIVSKFNLIYKAQRYFPNRSKEEIVSRYQYWNMFCREGRFVV